MTSDRSTVVFGPPGSGKSAVCTMLAHHAGERQRLPVYWYPHLDIAAAAGQGPFAQQVQSVLEPCLLALLEHLAHTPVQTGSSWLVPLLGWLCHTFIRGDLSVRLGPLLEERDPSSGDLWGQILQASPQDLLPRSDYRQILAELGKLLPHVGLEAIWVLADMAEEDILVEDWPEAIQRFLQALPLFEQPRLAYKFFFPARFQELAGFSVLERRRADLFLLRWKVEELYQIVGRRLALATGNPSIGLKDLCIAPDWPSWLEKVGGTNPREWLIQVHPVLAYFLSHEDRPVDCETWLKLRLSPSLYLDENRGILRIGGQNVPLSRISGQGYQVLRYLYKHPNRIISRAELYYRAVRGLDHVPRGPADEAYEGPAEYRSIMDNLVHRLREAIEPDPQQPVLLQTVRGHGVRLVVRRGR